MKRALYAAGLFLAFFGVFFAINPRASIHSPQTGVTDASDFKLETGADVAYAEVPATIDTSPVGGDDDCDDGGSGDADDDA